MYAHMRRSFAVSLLGACFIGLLLFAVSGCEQEAGFKSRLEMEETLVKSKRRTFKLEDLAAQSPRHSRAAPASSLKVGFVFTSMVGDYGFAYSHNQGRLALMEELGVETLVLENIPEDHSCLGAIRKLINEGCTVIFTCSYGFKDWTAQMAEAHPEVRFFNCAGNIQRENMSHFFGKMYQVRYLTGIVAGLRTESDKIGYIAAQPLPEVIRGANAFALGVKSVRPQARVLLTWSGAWYAPGLERKLTLFLIDQGCDVIAQHQDSVAPQVAAAEMGVWSIGYHSPMGFFAKKSYLTGAVWNWAPYMLEQVRNIEAGVWVSSGYWGGLEDGVVALDGLTEHVAPGTQEAVKAGLAAIEGGFNIFTGPLYDNKGVLRLAEGEILTDQEKLDMDWLVDSIDEKNYVGE